MILVDSSVWIDHFRKPNSRLANLLNNEHVLVHPLVIGEIACGNLKNRTEIIALLHALPQVHQADDEEILFFLERHRLNGRGIGLIDVHLLASCFISHGPVDPCFLWTADKRLKAVARHVRVDVSQQK